MLKFPYERLRRNQRWEPGKVIFTVAASKAVTEGVNVNVQANYVLVNATRIAHAAIRMTLHRGIHILYRTLLLICPIMNTNKSDYLGIPTDQDNFT